MASGRPLMVVSSLFSVDYPVFRMPVPGFLYAPKINRPDPLVLGLRAIVAMSRRFAESWPLNLKIIDLTPSGRGQVDYFRVNMRLSPIARGLCLASRRRAR